MQTKSSQLQIRVTVGEKAALKRLAAEAGLSVSAFVLARALPDGHQGVSERIARLRGGTLTHALAELVRHLGTLPDRDFEAAVAGVDTNDLTPLQANCAAGAVEGEAWKRGKRVPTWAQGVAPLESPHFGWSLRSLRPHLLRITPAALKRRGVFLALPQDDRR